MSLSGQCPACRRSIAFSEASLAAARLAEDRRGGKAIRCECSANLIAKDLSDISEIEAVCGNCESVYVVDRNGAGERLPCRCGETVVVPSVILVEAPVEASGPIPSDPGPIPSDPGPIPSETGPVPSELVRLPIVGVPDLHSIEICDRIDAASPEPETTKPTAESRRPLPIVAVPILYKIEVPKERERPARDQMRLPIVALPELHQIGLPDLPCKRQQPLVKLPIVALPAVYSIGPPPAATVACSHDLGNPKSYATTRFGLPRSLLDRCQGDQNWQQSIEPETKSETLSTDPVPERTEEPRETPLANEEPEDHTIVTCPGCSREYSIPSGELGQTAECRRGFIFFLRENISALDSVLCTNLMPYPPLVVDRTGLAAEGRSNVHSDSESVPESKSVTFLVEDPSKSNLARLANLFLALSIVLIVAVSAVIGWRLVYPETVVSVEPPRLVAAKRPTPIAGPKSRDAKAEEVGLPGSAENVVQASGRSSFLTPIEEIAADLNTQSSLGRESLYRFADAVEKLGEKQSELSVEDLFWLAEQWRGMGQRAESAELAGRCYWQAAAAFALSQTVAGIGPDRIAEAKREQERLSQASRNSMRIASRERPNH